MKARTKHLIEIRELVLKHFMERYIYRTKQKMRNACASIAIFKKNVDASFKTKIPSTNAFSNREKLIPSDGVTRDMNKDRVTQPRGKKMKVSPHLACLLIPQVEINILSAFL